jgi:hypothetical protein
VSRRVDMIAPNELLSSTVSHDEAIRRVFALPALQYSVSGRADFLALWQELPVSRPERYATPHPKKSKPMVRFVL